MKKILPIALVLSVLFFTTACEEPSLTIVSSATEITSEGGEVTIAVTSNVDWTATCATEGITLTPSSGKGDQVITVAIPEIETEEGRDITVTVAAPEKGLTQQATIIQKKPSLEYAGVTYKIKKMADNRWWMVENLRYIPSGVTPSSDPTVDAGMWYACDAEKNARTSQDDIETYGYLYDAKTFLAASDFTEANYNTYEGKQGICPEGWYIPSSDDMNTLLQAYWDPDVQKGAPTAALEAAGFNPILAGFRMKNTNMATGAYSPLMSYFATSTGSKYTVNATTGAVTCMNKGAMRTNTTTYQRYTIADASNFGGVLVRCIKSK